MCEGVAGVCAVCEGVAYCVFYTIDILCMRSLNRLLTSGVLFCARFT